MWVSITLLGVSLASLIALFACKAVEQAKGKRTPLTALRDRLDVPIEDGLRFVQTRVRRISEHHVKGGLKRGSIQTLGFLSTLSHRIAKAFLRSGRRLRAKHLRGIENHKKGSVSFYLRDVSEDAQETKKQKEE